MPPSPTITDPMPSPATPKSNSTPASKNPKHVYPIGGVLVEFPYQPYGSQLAFMSRVIHTLDRAKRDGHCNALLESPTGTGKTLSLLCSVLAWQQNCKKNSQMVSSQMKPAPEAYTDPLGHGGGFIPESQPSSFPPSARSEASQSVENSKPKKIPKIYYATRTHSQISQVIREYKKTGYRVPMAVLGSRKHYCTNPHVRGKENIDEACKSLLKNEDDECIQFKNMHKVKCHPSLQKGGCHEAHDIEDLLKVGKLVKGCAYYAARALADDAELVFCPYNYIVNPVIRGAMDVTIKESIIILDEAHNMEDIARDAGSMDIEEDVLFKLQMELQNLCLEDPMIYQPLQEMIEGLLGWIDTRKNKLEKHEFQHYLSCWTGDKAVKELQEANISQQYFPTLLECATKAIKVTVDADSEAGRHLSGMAVTTLEGLFSSLTYFFSRDGSHVSDYQLALQRYVKRDRKSSGEWICSLSLWCLNPAVVFKDIASLSLSIILTSGTLSPMSSFSSELGVQFETSLEAPHVINESQVWTGIISKGPGNYPLNASYKTADAYEFQDALGKSLEEICKIVPGGSLVFFPSYKLMEKLCNRWRETGQWSQLNARKTLFVEPRGGQEDFETTLKGYYDTICGRSRPPIGKKRKVKATNTNTIESPEITKKEGAALLAVCRGKVSEGLDFADDNARVVIVVGIPFPNMFDVKVSLKKKYNDTYKSSKTLLNGNDWYCQQAFRALNQAIGRCIRHRYDYGAIILLDSRFEEERNKVYISKWLRKSIRHFGSFDSSMEELKSFFRDVKDQVDKDKASSGIDSFDKKDNISSTKKSLGITRKQNLKPEQSNFDEQLSVEEFNRCFRQPRAQCATAVKASVQEGSRKNIRRDYIDLESNLPNESRCFDTPPVTFFDEDPDMTLVRETPGLDADMSVASPACLFKDGNSGSRSTITEPFTESPNQSSLRSKSLTSLNEDPCRDESVLTITPQKDSIQNTSSLKQRIDSNFSLSVSSHTQKRKKFMASPVIDLVDDEKSDIHNKSAAGYANSKRNVEVIRESTRRIEFGTETSCAEDQSQKIKNSQSLAVDKRLQISCSLCKSPLCLHNNSISCSFTSTTKAHIVSLFKERTEHGDSNVLTAVPVIMTDTSSVDPRINNNAPGGSAEQGIWCKDDGCVFNNIYCPFCSSPKSCLGVQVVATDAANVQLLDKMLFYRDHLEIRDSESSENKISNKVLLPSNNNLKVEKAAIFDSIEKFSFTSQCQDSGGWRTTKSKMRLPKRC